MSNSVLSTLATHRLLAGGVALAAITGSGAVLALRPATYEAVAQVSVTPLSGDVAPAGIPVFRELGEPIRTIETAAALLHTRSAADLTAQRLGRPWTTDLVFRTIEVQPHGQTNLVDVIARTDAAESAARVANEYLAAVLEQRNAAVTAAAARALVDAAGAPAQPGAGPNPSANLILLRDAGDPSASAVEQAAVPLGRSGLSPLTIIALSMVAGVLVLLSLLTALGGQARSGTLNPAAGVGAGGLISSVPSSNGRLYAPDGRSGSTSPS